MSRGSTILLALLVVAGPLSAQMVTPASGGDDIAAGHNLFATQCARCHGVGGTGGIGPSLTHPALKHATTDDELVGVILNGVPGTAMVGFWNFTADEAKQVAAYVRALGKLPPEVLPGDPSHGRRLYEQKGQCGTCHLINGQGAGWAPDLSDVGRRLSGALLRQSLTDPGAMQPPSPLPAIHGPYPAFTQVRAVTRTGRTIRGSRINEDDFTIQIRDESGHLVSLDKARLRRLEKLPGQSPMPSFQTTFSSSELDDVVAYLASLKGAQ
jgi:putative heme-binding domain-containing protein